MTRFKKEKGITLVALIITIIILLILAVVTIRAITGDGILQYAKNATNEYEKAQDIEDSVLESYADKLREETLPPDALGKAKVDVETTRNSTINGEKYSSTNPIIPAGFKAINTGTSSWDAENLESQISKGLVIKDKANNEFVWIPVQVDASGNCNSFARLQENSTTDYRGVLYDWKKDSTGNTAYSWTATTTDYREPDVVTQKSTYNSTTSSFENSDGSDYDSANLEIAGCEDVDKDGTLEAEDFKKQLQSEFNKMVASVKEYGGFYVGRYETSLNATTGVAQSVSGETPMKSKTWYEMYKNSKTYSTSGVISEMIWGCQWDAMLKMILEADGGDATKHVTATTNVAHASSKFTTKPYKTGGIDYSTNYKIKEGQDGYVPYKDIASNIYDLEGNVFEWTQEANYTRTRVYRGGHYGDSYSPSRRGSYDPAGSGSNYGSRLTLYVEL